MFCFEILFIDVHVEYHLNVISAFVQLLYVLPNLYLKFLINGSFGAKRWKVIHCDPLKFEKKNLPALLFCLEQNQVRRAVASKHSELVYAVICFGVLSCRIAQTVELLACCCPVLLRFSWNATAFLHVLIFALSSNRAVLS